MLEKSDAFTVRDVENQLCVMLLMLPSAARQSKETLRMFRDSGRFTSFFPPEDDSLANAKLLTEIPTLHENDLADLGWKDGIVPGSRSVKQSESTRHSPSLSTNFRTFELSPRPSSHGTLR